MTHFEKTVKTRRGFLHGFRSVMTKDEWLTPLPIVRSLGPFDLDPCAPVNRPWPTAAHHYTINEDGLLQRWFGRVWLNPPYSNISPWLERLSNHGHGIALIFARTETRWFFVHVWQHASAVFFFKGRIAFITLTAQSGAPLARLLVSLHMATTTCNASVVRVLPASLLCCDQR